MHLLFITYEFPPKGGPGVQRPLKTARYLAEAGWDVTVLTVKDPPTALVDEGLLSELPDDVCVKRAWSLEPTRLLQVFRPGRSGGAGSSASYSGAPSAFIRFVRAFFFPDEKVGWTPFAIRKAVRLHRERPFDVILASAPPSTAYRVAWKLSSRLSVPWVADLRDPIYGGYFFRPPTPLHSWWMQRFERRVVRSAARTIVVTDEMRDSIVDRNPDVADRLAVVTNGFDPAEFVSDVQRTGGGFSIAYVGTFQGTIRPDAFLEGLNVAVVERPHMHEDTRVVFVGPLADDTTRAIERTHTGEYVYRTGFVSHGEAVKRMLSADVLLLMLGPEPESAAILTGKLPEYLGARRTVLGLVPEGVAANVVREAGGTVVHPDDVRGIADAILALHDDWRAGSLPVPPPGLVERFDRRVLVARVAEILHDAIAGHEEERGSDR